MQGVEAVAGPHPPPGAPETVQIVVESQALRALAKSAADLVPAAAWSAVSQADATAAGTDAPPPLEVAVANRKPAIAFAMLACGVPAGREGQACVEAAFQWFAREEAAKAAVRVAMSPSQRTPPHRRRRRRITHTVVDGKSVLEWTVVRSSVDHAGRVLNLVAQALPAAAAAFRAQSADGVNEALAAAAAAGHVPLFHPLLELGATLNAAPGVTTPPLVHAARSAQPAAVAALLGLDAGDATLALQSALQDPATDTADRTQDAVATLQLLLDAGGNASSLACHTAVPLVCTVARRADSHRLLPLLLAAGCDASRAYDARRRTPLHDAVTGSPRGIALLLEAGADVNGADRFGNTPLSLACEGRHAAAARALVHAGAELAPAPASGRLSPLHAAAKAGACDIVRLLVQHRGVPAATRNRFGHTPLLVAMEHGHADVCRLLIELGASAHDEPSELLRCAPQGGAPLLAYFPRDEDVPDLARRCPGTGRLSFIMQFPPARMWAGVVAARMATGSLPVDCDPAALTADATLQAMVSTVADVGPHKVLAVARGVRFVGLTPGEHVALGAPGTLPPKSTVTFASAAANLKTAVTETRAVALRTVAGLQPHVGRTMRWDPAVDTAGGDNGDTASLAAGDRRAVAVGRVLAQRRMGRMRHSALVEPLGRDVLLFL